jgi:hypothetical protein
METEKEVITMCMPKAPKVNTPPPPPQLEQAKPEDIETKARQDERRRMKGAVNSRSTILSSGYDNGRKTLLGQ